MKTSTKALFGGLLLLLMLMASTVTTFAKDITFNKIKISGNVKLELVQSGKESVTVFGDYSSKATSIQLMGYTLIIKSSEYEPVTIRVSVKDLQRIDASDEVEVQTIGPFNVKYLQIFLKDDAKANVKASTESMYTFIRDRSDLRISGITLDHTVVRDSVSKLTMQNFVAVKTTNNSIVEAMAYILNVK